VIRAFERLGWEVRPFIVGDRVPRQWVTGDRVPMRWVTEGSEQGVRLRRLLWFRRLLWVRRLLWTLAADLLRPLQSAVNARRAWQELGGRVDWVYERCYPYGSMGRIFKRHGVPWILETNVASFYEAAEAETITRVLPDFVRRLEIRAYEECDVLVCISETLKEILVHEAGISPAKVVVISNAVDPSIFDPERYEPTRVFEGLVIGYVGELQPRKGLELLIEALSELRTEGLEISLVVVGHGRWRAVWEALARRLGVLEHVAFVGQVRWEEVPGFITGFDLGYSGQAPTKGKKTYDSPLKLYEYMAMAKPVVASDWEDASWVVQDEETGFLFRPGDKEDLKSALRRAYEYQDRLPEMGSKAREEITSKHDWSDRVRDIISAVEDRLQSL
jgi:glycosyltransferase involved in cell wall biosynthesis